LKRSLKLEGKLFNGGLLLLMSVWQMTHIGTAGVVNWLRWQSVQALWPGKRGVAELSVRS
jgi:hypothetical protein